MAIIDEIHNAKQHISSHFKQLEQQSSMNHRARKCWALFETSPSLKCAWSCFVFLAIRTIWALLFGRVFCFFYYPRTEHLSECILPMIGSCRGEWTSRLKCMLGKIRHFTCFFLRLHCTLRQTIGNGSVRFESVQTELFKLFETWIGPRNRLNRTIGWKSKPLNH